MSIHSAVNAITCMRSVLQLAECVRVACMRRCIHDIILICMTGATAVNCKVVFHEVSMCETMMEIVMAKGIAYSTSRCHPLTKLILNVLLNWRIVCRS